MKSILLLLLYTTITTGSGCHDPVSKPEEDRVLSVFNGVVGTVQPTSTSVSSTSKPDCTPKSPSTFLFGFSNDLDINTIKAIIDKLRKIENVSPRFTSFGFVRFDDGKQKEIQFYKNTSAFLAAASSQLPDPSLRSSNKSIGSDILKVIEKFLNNTEAPTCGCKILLIMKRFPNEFKSGDLIPRLQEQHVTVNTLAPSNSSGGLHKESVYEIVSKTFGIGFVSDVEKRMHWGINDFNSFAPSFLIYANDTISASHGYVQGWDTMKVPYSDQYYMLVTLEDEYPLDEWTHTDLKLIENSTSINTTLNAHVENNNWFESNPISLNAGNYAVNLNFWYHAHEMNNLRTRIYRKSEPDYWIDYKKCCYFDGTHPKP